MKRHFSAILALLLSFVIHGQYNDTTIVVDGVTTNLTEFVQSGTNNFLLVTNGANVTLGTFTGPRALANAAVVTGVGSILQFGGSVLGDSNTLEVVDGGSISTITVAGTHNAAFFRNVESHGSVQIGGGASNYVSVLNSKVSADSIGIQNATDSTMQIVSSELTNRWIGVASESNIMILRAGTRASAKDWQVSGNRSFLEATDHGTTLSASSFVVGTQDWSGSIGGSSFLVSNGARADIGQYFTIGGPLGLSGSASNHVRVVGGGSEVLVGRTLSLGTTGRGWNTLTIADGAKLVSSNATVGAKGLAVSNTVTLSGSGSFWSNAAALKVVGNSNRFNVLNGAGIHTGTFSHAGTNNHIFMEPTSEIIIDDELVVGDFTVENDSLLIEGDGVVNVGSLRPKQIHRGHQIEIRDRVRLFVVTNLSLTVDSNFVDVAQGAKLVTPLLAVGSKSISDSSNNVVRVRGAESELATDSLSIASRLNHIFIEDGATLSTANYTNVGGGGSTINVNGAGSIWNHSGDLIIGSTGSNNVVTVSAGATVTNRNASFGEYRSSAQPAPYTFTKLIVEGPGTRWLTGSNLYIGLNANGNSMTVRDGATVSAQNLGVGVYGVYDLIQPPGYQGTLNKVEVDGPGTRLDVAGDIVFGRRSINNRFRISSGGTVTAENFFAEQLSEIGPPISKPPNVLEIDGAQSKLLLNRDFVSPVGGACSSPTAAPCNAGPRFKLAAAPRFLSMWIAISRPPFPPRA